MQHAAGLGAPGLAVPVAQIGIGDGGGDAGQTLLIDVAADAVSWRPSAEATAMITARLAENQ